VVSPLADYGLGFFQTVEDFAIEQLVTQLAIEGFTISVLPRTTRLDVKGFRANARQPTAYDLRRHLWTVIRSDVFWNAVHDHGIGHRLDDAHAVDPPCNTDRKTFPRELVDQRHQPDFPAVMGLSFDEVVRPDVIAPLRSQPDAAAVAQPQPSSWPLFLRYFQPLTAPDALHAINANTPSCFLQKSGDPSIAIAAILRRQLQYRSRQPILVSTHDHTVTLRAARLTDDPAGMAFRQAILRPGFFHRLPAPFGAYKFPSAMSFSTCFSIDKSATSRFRRAFSFSRSFIRRA